MPDLISRQLYAPLLKHYRKVRRLALRLFPQVSDLVSVMKQQLPPNPVLVEAGAHIGVDTLKFSQLWPQGHIHAFEPVPAIFAELQQRVAGCGNVTCYPT